MCVLAITMETYKAIRQARVRGVEVGFVGTREGGWWIKLPVLSLLLSEWPVAATYSRILEIPDTSEEHFACTFKANTPPSHPPVLGDTAERFQILQLWTYKTMHKDSL
jgi:hypothetical protein